MRRRLVIFLFKLKSVYECSECDWIADVCSSDLIKEYGHDFDLIIASEVFGFHTLTAAVYSPCNTIVWHELVKHQKKFFSIPSKIWHNVVVSLFYKKIRLVIPRSDASYNFISKYLKQVSKVSVDHGINISNFKTATNKKRQFISIAQLIKRKNIDSIIRKFHSFVSNPLYSDFQLLLAGRGDEEPKLQKLVENLKLENNVHFLGFLTHTELNEYVSESYASLIDTYNDLNMVSIPEAIVSGTPIITNLVPALAEFINVEGLGIAKQGWGISDMEEIVQNDNYHNNCLKWRDKLSTEQAAEKLVSLFLSANH